MFTRGSFAWCSFNLWMAWWIGFTVISGSVPESEQRCPVENRLFLMQRHLRAWISCATSFDLFSCSHRCSYWFSKIFNFTIFLMHFAVDLWAPAYLYIWATLPLWNAPCYWPVNNYFSSLSLPPFQRFWHVSLPSKTKWYFLHQLIVFFQKHETVLQCNMCHLSLRHSDAI